MIDIFICDDNPLHNQFLHATTTKMLRCHELPGQIVMSVSSVEALLAMPPKEANERLFLLDIHLGEGVTGGIELAEKIREADRTAYIVFVTAHQQYSLVGYKTKAFDFLLKPLSEEMVEQMLLRVFADLEASKSGERMLRLKVGSVYHNIPYSEILCFEKMKNILYVHTMATTYSAYESLKSVSEAAPPNFVMCHKSYIVASDKITSLDTASNMVRLANGKACPVSRRFKAALADSMVTTHGD